MNIFKAMKNKIPKTFTFYSGWEWYGTDYDHFIKNSVYNPVIQAPFQEMLSNFQSIKLKVYKGEGKDKVESESSSANMVMGSLKKPNKELTFSQLQEAYLNYMYFGGRCLFYKTGGVLKKDIFLYSPSGFYIRRSENKLIYDAIKVGDTVYSSKADLKNFHVSKNFNPFDSIAGLGNGFEKVKPLALIGDTADYILKYNVSMLKNGGMPRGIINFEGNMSPKASKEYKDKSMSELIGSENNGGLKFLTGAKANFISMGTNPKDLDWIQGLIEIQKMACRAMNVPESLILSENSSYNNLEGFKTKIYEDTIIPIAKRFSEDLTELFKSDLAEGEYIDIDISSVKALQMDIADEIKKFSEALQGKITINNFIEFINDKYDLSFDTLGKEGDVVLVSSNTETLSNISQGFPGTPQGEVE